MGVEEGYRSFQIEIFDGAVQRLVHLNIHSFISLFTLLPSFLSTHSVLGTC